MFWVKPICGHQHQTTDASSSHMLRPGEALWGVRMTYCTRVGTPRRRLQNHLTTQTKNAFYCNSWQMHIPIQDALSTGQEALSYYCAIVWNLFVLSQNLLPFNFQPPKHLVPPRAKHPSVRCRLHSNTALHTLVCWWSGPLRSWRAWTRASDAKQGTETCQRTGQPLLLLRITLVLLNWLARSLSL